MSSVHHIVPAAYALLHLRHVARGTVPTPEEVVQALKEAKIMTDEPARFPGQATKES